MIIYDENKAIKLKFERDIDIDEVAQIILDQNYLDILEHPKRINQLLFIIFYKKYTYVVPFVIDKNNNIIIKTVYPSKKFHKIYKEKEK